MYQTILFDLDGTLTDSKAGITKSVQYALAHHDIHVEDLGELEHFIGPPLQHSFKEHYQFDDEAVALALSKFHEYFEAHGMFDNAVYPGIPELLTRLQNDGRTLVVATAKPLPFAKQILEYFHLSQFFDHVEGPPLEGALLHKADIVRLALERLPNPLKSATVMVGDRKHDIAGARECGIDSIAVLYGYGSKEELEKEQPTHAVESVEALEGLLLR